MRSVSWQCVLFQRYKTANIKKKKKKSINVFQENLLRLPQIKKKVNNPALQLDCSDSAFKLFQSFLKYKGFLDCEASSIDKECKKKLL